jgi:hypothetical protein
MDAQKFQKELNRLSNEAIKGGEMTWAEVIGVLTAETLNVHRLSLRVEMADQISQQMSAIMPENKLPGN